MYHKILALHYCTTDYELFPNPQDIISSTVVLCEIHMYSSQEV